MNPERPPSYRGSEWVTERNEPKQITEEQRSAQNTKGSISNDWKQGIKHVISAV
jgi:hypothetical protein